MYFAYRSVCHSVLGQEGGACSDEKLGGINNHQLHTSTRLVCHSVLGQEGGACSDEKLGGINNHQLHTSTRLTDISTA